MPSLTQLEYIVAVETLRHFGKAAEACHITQPTLSMQIQKVEEEIGYALFDRLKKPVVPTAKGLRFIQQAKVLLHEHRKLIDLSKNQGGEVSGEFRLGVIPTVGPYLLPLFLKEFSERFPQVRLVVDELKTAEILKALHADQLDAGLLATPLKEPGLRERPLYYEPFYVYTAKDSSVHSRKKIKDTDLDNHEMWLLNDGHCFRTQIMRFCALDGRQGVYANVHFAGGTLDTLRHLIRQSRGYTLVPSLFVETLTADERREHVREFEKPVPTREISLLYRRDQWKSDILKALETVIRERLPKSLKERREEKSQQVLPVEEGST